MAISKNYEITNLFVLTKITFKNEHSCSFAIFIKNDIFPNLVFINYLSTVAKKTSKKSNEMEIFVHITVI